MKILSHRGYWKTLEEKNQRTAFARSFALGFGTETDFRDWNGSLVISHDPAGPAALPAEDFFQLLVDSDRTLPLAINIKADGLQLLIAQILLRYQVSNYFLFDMSVADAVRSLKQGLRCFTRHSDLEPVPSFYEQAAGVWMDSFYQDWITTDHIRHHLNAGKEVCLVSPELHHRDYLPFWVRLLAAEDLLLSPSLMLCTDIPEKAVNLLKQNYD